MHQTQLTKRKSKKRYTFIFNRPYYYYIDIRKKLFADDPTDLSFLHASIIVGNKKLDYRRETTRRFVSLNILLSHSRSFETTLLRKACVSPYQYFNDTMSVCRTVSEIFSVKEWRDLETVGRGRSRSLKIAPFDRS